MANTLANLYPDIYEGLNRVSRELTGFITAVSRDSTVARAAIGENVRVPIAGAITGAVTVNSGAHIAPGASIESLDVGSLTLAAGSILDFELDTVLGVDGPAFGRQVLAGVCSVLLSGGPRLVNRWVDDAALFIWSTGEEWLSRKPGEAAAILTPGDVLRVGGHALTAVLIPLTIWMS